MSLETEQSKGLRRSREAVEMNREVRENKEGEPNQEEKAAAAMERADYLVKEVKQNKQQMQNIFLHMQQVMQAINQLRAQLQLVSDDSEPESVKQDKKQIDKLKMKISEYKDEIIKMKDDLIKEYVEELRNNGESTLSAEVMKQKAEAMVDELLSGV